MVVDGGIVEWGFDIYEGQVYVCLFELTFYKVLIDLPRIADDGRKQAGLILRGK